MWYSIVVSIETSKPWEQVIGYAWCFLKQYILKMNLIHVKTLVYSCDFDMGGRGPQDQEHPSYNL